MAALRKKTFTRKTVPLYLMILPALVLTFLFQYVTIPGKLLAFMDWRVSGFNGWVGFLDAGTYTREQVINGFYLSTEYHDRFLPQ